MAQYYQRGVNLNNNYLPNLDEPHKWIFNLDGIFDWQKESLQAGQTSYQLSRANINIFYGGQLFRGGVQVGHDFNRDVKDISVGLGFSYNRPFFIEGGVAYLNRLLNNTSYDGTTYNLKAGYYFNWKMHISYRVRIRFSLASSYKKVNSGSDHYVITIYPLIGFEFET
jgi:hypothetical protein